MEMQKRRPKLQISFVRCDLHHARYIPITEEAWALLKGIIEGAGFDVLEEEIKYHPYISEQHHWYEVVQSVFEVQGLKFSEGASIVQPLERLVCEYAKLK